MKTLAARIAAASDPATPPEELTRLSTHRNIRLLEAIARNPNTPAHILNRLWELHPHTVLDNPVLALREFTGIHPLHTTLDAGILLGVYQLHRQQRLPLPKSLFPNIEVIARIAQHASLHQDPRAFPHLVRERHPSIRSSLLTCIRSSNAFLFFRNHMPDEAWSRLATDPNPSIRESLAVLVANASPDDTSTPAIDDAIRLLMANPGGDSHHHLRNCPLLPADVIAALAASAEVKDRVAAAAASSRSTRDVVDSLLNDPEPAVIASLAAHSARRHVHHALLRDKRTDVIAALASNRSLDKATLAAFPSDVPSKVLQKLFLHPHATLDFRIRILRNARPETQGFLTHCGHLLTPKAWPILKPHIHSSTLASFDRCKGLGHHVIDDLIAHPSHNVRLAVARRMGNQYCRSATDRNCRLVARLATDPHPAVRLAICTDHRIEQSTALDLLADPDPRVRLARAKHDASALAFHRNTASLFSYEDHYNTVAAHLTELANDPHTPIRTFLARFQETPPDALGILFDDPDDNVAELARNPRPWPFGVVLDLEADHPRNPPPRHGRTTPGPAALHILARSPNPFLRFLTASCSRTTLGDLRLLARDPHPVVRDKALSNLND